MEETAATKTGGNHPLAEFQIIMQKMGQMELQAQAIKLWAEIAQIIHEVVAPKW